MDSIIGQLDRVKLPSHSAAITGSDMNGKLGAQLVMKRALLALSAGEPFNVNDFVFGQEEPGIMDVNKAISKYKRKVARKHNTQGKSSLHRKCKTN